VSDWPQPLEQNGSCLNVVSKVRADRGLWGCTYFCQNVRVKSFVVLIGGVCDRVHKQRRDCKSYTEHRTAEHNYRYTTTAKACDYIPGNFISIQLWS